jgi:hypothetical protein
MSFRQQRHSHPGIIIHDLFGSGYAGLGGKQYDSLHQDYVDVILRFGVIGYMGHL